jgi:hypothetical protein
MTRQPSPPTPSPRGRSATALIATAARKLLIIATGVSNSCRTGAWKTELQTQFCNNFGLTVTVAHYPTSASKWNPIEHRTFSEISKNRAAQPHDSYTRFLGLIRNTSTRTSSQSRLTSTEGIIQPAIHPIRSRSAVIV